MAARDNDRATVRRVLALGRCTLFHGVSPAELAILAENAIETEIPPGTTLAEAGHRLSAVHVIVEGEIASGGQRWEVHDAFGAMEVFADRTVAAAATTTSATRTLQLDAEDLTEILEDNFGVLLASLRSVALLSREPIVDTDPMPLAPAPLGLIDRLFLLRRHPVFARASVRSLATLAHAAQPVVWEPGVRIVHAAQPAAAVHIVVAGSVRRIDEPIDDPVDVGAGAMFGLVDTLANAPSSASFDAVGAVHGLMTPSAALLDVLEEHSDLGIAMLAALARVTFER